jgi:nitrogen fixation NifU-like protein
LSKASSGPVSSSERSPSVMRELYTQVIMDHYQRPRNRGKLEDADLREHLLNPLCGDEVTVYAVIDGEKVAGVKFEGRGCSISQASASMMTERLVGKSRAEAEKEIQSFKAMMVGEREFPEMDDLAALKGVIQYPSRIKCATLAWAAFEQGLEGRKG